MSGDHGRILHQARRALEARKNGDMAEWASVSVPAVKEKILNTTDNKVWLEGETGETIARWNGTFAPDILYEWRSERLFANVLFSMQTSGDSVVGDVYYYVQLVKVPDGGNDDWLYVQTVAASADTLANSGSRLKPSPEEAREVYAERQRNKASKTTQERSKGDLQLRVPGAGAGRRAGSTTGSVSDLGGSSYFSSDSDDELSGVFSPRIAMSPTLERVSQMRTSEDYVNQRRETEAADHVRESLASLFSMATLLGLSKAQFLECVGDVCGDPDDGAL